MNLTTKRYYEVSRGSGALSYLSKYAFVTWLGRRAKTRPMRMFVELASNIDRHIVTEGAFEKGLLDMLADVCRQTGHTALMIDIGANIGNHAIALAPVFDQIEAVEPHPVLFHVLMANKLRNGIDKMTCHNFGLANENTTGTLAESATNHGLSRVRERSTLSGETFGDTNETYAGEYQIPLRSTQEFVGQFVDKLAHTFIKIDVEGMEQEIIESLLPLIKAHRPLVGFEWFTRDQPDLTRIATSVPGYELYGIRVHDTGRNYVGRAIKMMFAGRYYTLEKIDPSDLDDVYPLALMVPIAT